MLRLEDENFDREGNLRSLYFIGIAAKRYVLFNYDSHGRVVIRKASEHALGQLLSPGREERDDSGVVPEIEGYMDDLLDRPDESPHEESSEEFPPCEAPRWVQDVWMSIIAAVRSRRPLRPPEWADRIAIARFAYTQPTQKKALGGFPGMKPANFVTVAYLSPWGRRYLSGPCVYEQRHVEQCPRTDKPCPFRDDCPSGRPVRPATAFLATAEGAEDAHWVDLHTGQALPIARKAGEDGFVLKTFADLIRDYFHHPEAKASGSRGELRRVHVVASERRRIGKEGHRLDERRVLLNPGMEAYLHYVDERANWKWARKVLATMPRDLLEEYSTMSGRRLRDSLQGRCRPHRTMRTWLVMIARVWERFRGDVEEFRRHMGLPPKARIKSYRQDPRPQRVLQGSAGIADQTSNPATTIHRNASTSVTSCTAMSITLGTSVARS